MNTIKMIEEAQALGDKIQEAYGELSRIDADFRRARAEAMQKINLATSKQAVLLAQINMALLNKD